MSEISILLTGDFELSEFIGVKDELQRYGGLYSVYDLEAAEEMLRQGEFTPDVIVVVQAFSGRFSHSKIDRLRRFAPLARILNLSGTWCEGEGRSGSPWPAAIRLYWHQWQARVERELNLLAGSQCPSWGLPVTATEDERLLQSVSQTWQTCEGLIAICAPRKINADWIAATCQMRGYSTIVVDSFEKSVIECAAAGIFDRSFLDDMGTRELKHFKEYLNDSPVIVLLDFPRVEDRQRAISNGAAAVLSKPVEINDLFWLLDRYDEKSAPAA